MGGWYNSIHVRSDSVDSVKDILQKLARDKKCRFYLAPPINGWVGIFAQMLPSVQISVKIAEKLPQDLIELAVYDDDVFCYWYFQEGKLIDSFNSCPDYFGQPVSIKDAENLKGRPEVFSGILESNEKVSRLRNILMEASQPPQLNIAMSEGDKERLNKMQSFSKAIHDFIEDPKKIGEFIRQNKDIFDDEVKSLAETVKQQNIDSQGQLEALIFGSGKANELGLKLMQRYVEKLRSTEEHACLQPGYTKKETEQTADSYKDSDDFLLSEQSKFPFSPPIFASEYMRCFADVLGIRNAINSYEYLSAGETDDISQWDEFIEIS